jgi:ATPase subunit of ABC transporter with duplicated ATPase domains
MLIRHSARYSTPLLYPEKGDRIGLIGHNGCGKSTLLKVLDGTISPASGAIALANHCHGACRTTSTRRYIASYTAGKPFCSTS